MIIPEKQDIKFSNPEGFLYANFVIINCIDKIVELQQIKTIKLNKTRSKIVNNITLLVVIIMMIIFIVFEFGKNSYYALTLSIFFFIFSITYKKYIYIFSLSQKNEEKFEVEINKVQKEYIKDLIFRIKKSIT